LAGSSSLILARIFGQLSASATLAFLIFKKDGKLILENIRWRLMLQGIKIYKKFPLYNIWAAFLSNLTLYIPGLMLSSYFSPREAGFFAMGNNVLRLPISLVGTSIGQVFAQRSAKSFNEGRLRQTVLDTYKRLVVFGLFPMLLVGLIGKELFIVVFGDKWADAGVYSQILSIWTFFYFLVSPISNLTNVLGKNEASLLINLIRAVTSVLALLIGGMTGNIFLGLWLLAISGSVTYAFFVVWINKLSGIQPKATINIFLSNLVLCSPFIIAILGFKILNPLPGTMLTTLNIPLNYVGLILFSGITTIVYFLVALKQDDTVKEAGRSIIKKYIKK
jgi:O-antigen/teichoic acid export membrane protein